MQGSLSLGRDVIETLSRFLGQNYIAKYSRRSLTPIREEDTITDMVKSSLICRELKFCRDDLRKFIDEYVVIQAKAVQNILAALLGDQFIISEYENQLKLELEHIRRILKHADKRVSDENITEAWINAVKKISSKFQEIGTSIASEILQIDKKKLNKQLNQKLILATIIVEMRYLNKLCVDNNICVENYECTVGLNTILEHFKTMNETKVRLFIRYFYEALYDTLFYTCLDESTAHEFQVVLNDMAYSDNVPTKEVLSAVQTIVAARLDFIKSSKDEKLSHDSLLLHAILSDMDHFYGHKSNPFGVFLNYFFEWTVKDETYLCKHMRQVLNEIGKELMTVSDDLLLKLVSEVKVFLEITVDPEK
ncbi:unnamed protein product [Colias eurytheme]|nr:unnamed protein product [Colias eurytheme]